MKSHVFQVTHDHHIPEIQGSSKLCKETIGDNYTKEYKTYILAPFEICQVSQPVSYINCGHFKFSGFLV